MRYISLLVIFIMLFTLMAVPVLAEDNTSQTTQQDLNIDNPAKSDISKGLPEVTPEQFSGKINGIAGKVYGVAANIIPYISVAVIVIGAIIGIFIEKARMAVLWAILGLIGVLWAPQIVGFVISLVK
ncbi:hypothetical protein [Carboxydothermus ferrireducens]|uniref:TrbC/VIRB2 family protein n=1 Tax=Carboxydothermus ferrireducens DSM 11255 TaxID=1119529 RepID=A0ABX2RB85_9THEO|nr:hypothetical protein [Carboxydothermus ferrireducens]NYE57130.1 hypothetical protein [Carboxydothermus ferrireducens DSM 11255]